MKKPPLKYPTFRTVCYKCDKGLRLTAFNVFIGAQSFALCPEHLVQFRKITSTFVNGEV